MTTRFQKAKDDSHLEAQFVVFTASWCGPCKQLKPELAKVTAELGKEFIFIDAESQAECVAAGIRNVPTVIALANGQEVDRFSGFKTKAQIIPFVTHNGEEALWP